MSKSRPHRSFTWLALASLLAVLLSGCAATEDSLTDVPSTDSVSSGLGSLDVQVLDISNSPLAGAQVAVATDRVGVTDAQGKALLDGIPAGEHVVVVSLEGYRTGTAGARIEAGRVTTLEVKLQVGEAVQPPPSNQTRPNEVFRLTGYFDCSATYIIITGDCATIVDNVTATGGQGTPAGDLTDEQFLLDFPVDYGWRSVVGEMFWQANGPANGQDMTFALEPTEFNSSGHAPKFARSEGASPLRWVVHAGEPHDTATATFEGAEPDMPNPNGGEVLRTRSYVAGQLLHRPAGTTFLGVGVALQQKFEVVVTVFYAERAAEDYTVQGLA